MPTHRLPRFAHPQFLRSVEPLKLAELFRPYADYFRARGIDLAFGRGLDDSVSVLRLFANPDDEMPSALFEIVCMLDELLASEAFDELLAEGAIPPNDSASPEDAIVDLFLTRPDLAIRKHHERSGSRPRSYLVCRPVGRKVLWKDEPPRKALNALQQSLSQSFVSRNRSKYVELQAFPRSDEVRFLIRRGQTLRREESVKEPRPELVCFRPTRTDIVVFERKTRRLRLHAESLAQARWYAREFGRHLFGNEAYFMEMPHYSLQPLRDAPRIAMNCDDVEGLEVVKLVELELLIGGAFRRSIIHKSRDLIEEFLESDEGFPQRGLLASAKFAVKFEGVKTPRRVEICPPNVANYRRDQDAYIIENWLACRGYLLGDHDWHLASA